MKIYICIEKCWKAKDCPDHGNRMNPFGRSSGLGSYDCCDNWQKSDVNPRHLWDVHDSTRWYTDPEGWDAHEECCPLCQPEGEIA